MWYTVRRWGSLRNWCPIDRYKRRLQNPCDRQTNGKLKRARFLYSLTEPEIVTLLSLSREHSLPWEHLHLSLLFKELLLGWLLFGFHICLFWCHFAKELGYRISISEKYEISFASDFHAIHSLSWTSSSITSIGLRLPVRELACHEEPREDEITIGYTLKRQ